MIRFVAATALVAAVAGFAPAAQASPNVGVSVTPGSLDVHVHSATCGHHHHDDYDDDSDSDRWQRRDRVVHRPGGYYERRTVDVWVPARTVEHVVPARCREHGGKHRKVKCKGGYVETRVIPGYYEPREEWVWVASAPRPRGVVRARW